ncbi:PREDICTED: GPI ethanolamine phosphate transferase 1-like [Priapulus caudatus]|uniref:GPI ethanolamine phosphate transferase 1 n=1 Tax=Priapulus caudatus TaxID=37621 RepID=A0ABM1E0F0_PRICU|nr:PREDICTED: GPI ethanolamine phosphate transferase 1-like [Priapulus caudatus]
MKEKWQVFLCIGIHLVLFSSIFDIYFTTPLVHGMTPYQLPVSPPAKRLVLFVADGLRADSLFGGHAKSETAKYLRKIVEDRGPWGVSHTHVPTESRPGHVAIIAGIYEDVSAVTKGWKENPVPFDTLFNESRYTWAWGSPDILPMFSKGATGDHVFTDMYEPDMEDFASKDASVLDTWVFEKVKEHLQSAGNNETLADMLSKDKIVLFLHLLGLDTQGHSHRPMSREYMENIDLVDKGVETVVNEIEEYFQHDQKTAYIFTSDHGMTNWGSHGAGHPHETLTPLVAWGAGLRAAEKTTVTAPQDDYSSEWGLASVRRTDVNQADINPLMSSLIGVPFSMNSVGLLPLDYLEESDSFKAHALFTNALQVTEQLMVKEKQKLDMTFSVMARPFPLLPASEQSSRKDNVKNLLMEKEYEGAINAGRELINLALSGLDYYQTYDWLLLNISVVMSFLGWVACIVIEILQHHTDIVPQRNAHDHDGEGLLYILRENVRLLLLLAAVSVFLADRSSPPMYYVYCFLPFILWSHVLSQRLVFGDALKYLMLNQQLMAAVMAVCLGIIAVQMLVLSFFYREVLSIGLVFIGVWPLKTILRETDKAIVYTWLALCLLVAVFPLLPVVGREANYYYVYLTAAITIGIAGFFLYRLKSTWVTDGQHTQTKFVCIIQIAFVCTSALVVFTTVSSLGRKQGLPLISRILSWTLLGLSLVLPLFSSTFLLSRLLTISLSLVSVYILMSTSYEALFCLSLCCLLCCWLHIEHRVAQKQGAPLSSADFKPSHRYTMESMTRFLSFSDLRSAYFYIFFIMLSFFGTGNIASINSFDPASVYCFLTVFSPFTMGALIVLKVLIPFILVSCAFHAVNVTVQVPTRSLFLLVLLMSDVMGLHFFFLVRNTGSWLDIGTSISHYVIAMTTNIFIPILYGLSMLFTTWSIPVTFSSKAHVT